MIDVDHFKRFNDRFGHKFGDHTLLRVGEILGKCLSRSSDLLFRLGGEEFGCIMCTDDSHAAIKDMAEKIRKQVELLPIQHHKKDIDHRITVSIGVKIKLPMENITSGDVYTQAYHALYKAKNSGRNKVCYADSTLAPTNAAKC